MAPREDIPQVDFSHGTDFEGEVAVILDDTPLGVDAIEALKYIRLIVLVNDVSLRGLIPEELKQGFGFFKVSLPVPSRHLLVRRTSWDPPGKKDGFICRC